MGAPDTIHPKTEAAPREQPHSTRPIPAAASGLASLLLALAFLAALVFPLLNTDFREIQKISLTEKRNLKSFPQWSWDKKAIVAFPTQFEAAFNDHFGFRSFAVRWYNRFQVWWLGVSPNEEVVLGREGWLYYRPSVNEYRGIEVMSHANADHWVRQLKTNQTWFAARNIRYLLVVAPNKEDVYPEFLPNNICRIREHRFLDDVLARLGPDSGVEILDLREALLKSKILGLVYDRTDTHWSQLGAFLATNQILQRLQRWFPDLQPSPLAQRTLLPRIESGGDLADMLNLREEMPEEYLIVPPTEGSFQSAPLRLQREWPAGLLPEAPAAFESKNPERLHTVLISGDSFGHRLMCYLPEHFRRVIRIRPCVLYAPWFQVLIPQLVEAEKPDLYLDVVCARAFRKPPPAQDLTQKLQ